jgi:hypothetical protein
MTAIEISDEQAEDNTVDSAGAVVTLHPHAERSQHLRILEAILFAATEPVSIEKFKEHLPETADVAALLEDLRENYSHRGVNLVQLAGKYMFRTAEDMAFVLRKDVQEQKRLTKAGLETLAIIAYHQPVTRAEIEDARHSPRHRLDQDAWTAQDAGASGDLRHHRNLHAALRPERHHRPAGPAGIEGRRPSGGQPAAGLRCSRTQGA